MAHEVAALVDESRTTGELENVAGFYSVYRKNGLLFAELLTAFERIHRASPSARSIVPRASEITDSPFHYERRIRGQTLLNKEIADLIGEETAEKKTAAAIKTERARAKKRILSIDNSWCRRLLDEKRCEKSKKLLLDEFEPGLYEKHLISSSEFRSQYGDPDRREQSNIYPDTPEGRNQLHHHIREEWRRYERRVTAWANKIQEESARKIAEARMAAQPVSEPATVAPCPHLTPRRARRKR